MLKCIGKLGVLKRALGGVEKRAAHSSFANFVCDGLKRICIDLKYKFNHWNLVVKFKVKLPCGQPLKLEMLVSVYVEAEDRNRMQNTTSDHGLNVGAVCSFRLAFA